MFAEDGEGMGKENDIPVMDPSTATPQGYLNPDMSKLGDAKQSRVLLYIGLALVPCLLLVPFFLSRDFVPPQDIPSS
jgi:hypothetical protein